MIVKSNERLIGRGVMASVLLTCVLGAAVSLKPVLTDISTMRAQHQATSDAIITQRQHLQAISQQRTRLSAQVSADRPEAPASFSPLAFKTLTDVYVVGWHPQDDGGELRLALDWQQVQPVMHCLKLYAMHIASLTLEPIKSRLAMTIRFHNEQG